MSCDENAKPKKRVSLPFEEWPAADRAAWLEAIKEGNFLCPPTAAAEWSFDTLETVRYNYGAWLKWFMGQTALGEDIAGRVTLKTTTAYIGDLEQRSPPYSAHTIWMRVKGVYDAMRVMVPTRRWNGLKSVVSVLQTKAEKEGNRELELPSIHELIAVGEALLKRAITQSAPTIDDAIICRDGIIVSILAETFIRRRACLAIAWDTTLVRKGDRYELHFKPEHIKTGDAREYELSERLSAVIERFRKIYWPMLRQADGGGSPIDGAPLWINKSGQTFGKSSFTQIVKARTLAGCGVAVSPHRFRHALATTITMESPEDIGIVPNLLGQNSDRMRDKHYDRADKVHARLRYRDLRERSRQQARRSRLRRKIRRAA